MSNSQISQDILRTVMQIVNKAEFVKSIVGDKSEGISFSYPGYSFDYAKGDSQSTFYPSGKCIISTPNFKIETQKNSVSVILATDDKDFLSQVSAFNTQLSSIKNFITKDLSTIFYEYIESEHSDLVSLEDKAWEESGIIPQIQLKQLSSSGSFYLEYKVGDEVFRSKTMSPEETQRYKSMIEDAIEKARADKADELVK